MSNKPWERPWTTEEIVENASNWNLGADVGLLKHLEQFSEDLLRKANATNNNLNNLLQNLTNASLSLDIARNEFLSLSNTQFIESRVYEDDETLPAENEQNASAEEKKQSEDDRIKDMKLAVMTGLEVLDKYFDKIEVPASDSEDETDCPSFVLRPKDPYLDRPLPYVIGSEEWHKKWHVGLEESSSDSETEKVSETFSDTDSESDLPVVNRQAKSMSESGSEADLSNRMQGVGPVANSTFNDTNKHFFGSSSSEEFNSVSTQAPISQNNFAEQLAAKLGNVVAHDVEVPEPEVNKRPIQKTSGVGDFGNLFSNEPPPLDDADDLFGAKSNQRGVFSGGDGLFDDLDNDVSFWGEKKPPVVSKQEPRPQEKTVPNLFDEDEDEEEGGAAIFTSAVQTQPKREPREEKEKKIDAERRPRGLFDDGDGSDDDDIFNADKLKRKLESIAQKQRPRPAESLFGEEPPPLSANENGDGAKKKKVPVGGVSVLARHEPQKALKTRQYSSESSDGDGQNLKQRGGDEGTEREVSGAPPPKGLFDQGDELFDDLFGPKKFSSGGLFDDEFENPKLFESPRKKEKGAAKNRAKPLSLFDDDDDDEEGSDGDFFVGISAKSRQSKPEEVSAGDGEGVSSPTKGVGQSEGPTRSQTEKEERQDLSLFDDEGGNDDGEVVKEGVNKTGQTLSLFDDEGAVLVVKEGKTLRLFDDDDEGAVPVVKESKTLSLFDDDDEGAVPVVKEGKTLSLFDDDDEGAEEDDDLFLIAPKTAKHKSETPQRNESVFKSESSGGDGDLFKEVIKIEDSTSGGEPLEPSKGDLFEDESVRPVGARSMGQTLTFDQSVSEEANPDLKNNAATSTDDSNLIGGQSGGKKSDLFDEFAVAKNEEATTGSHVNLFDPTPPPDLENWDTRSENNLFEDDIYSFDNGPSVSVSVSGQRSSIFDVEPPSLLYNESSGIVRDQSARNETTNDSSFFPYASSSRRLSTDLSSHEDDSIFVTKTKNVIDSKLLHDIPEVSPQASDESFTSALDLTPSGDVDDLYSEATTFTESLSKVEEKTEKTAGRTKDEERLEKKPPVPKAKPQIQQPEKDTKEEKPKDGGGPGKLKHNLNINVRALLPGAALHHRRNLEKSKSLDLSGDSERKIDADILGADDLLKDSKASEASHSDSNLYNPEGSVEVLQSITKDRARIPIRRRPSTKKGREAIRKSCIDFSALDRPSAIEAEAETEEKVVPKLAPQSQSPSHSHSQSFLAELSKKLLTDTEESKPPPIDVVKQTDMDVPNKSNQPTVTFDLEKEEAARLDPHSEKKEDLLAAPNFGGERRTSFVKTDNFESPDFKKSDLFDDEDNGDDIFSTKKLPPKSDMFKRSLFEDDDDDAEDIFGTPSAVTVKVSGVGIPQNDKSSGTRRPNKSSSLKKLENKEVIFDPLDALNQN